MAGRRVSDDGARRLQEMSDQLRHMRRRTRRRRRDRPGIIAVDNIPTLGMIANWEFDATGDVSDETTNGFTLRENGTTATISGVIGNAIRFDGSTSYYEAGTYPIFSQDAGNRAVRVRFRVNTEPTTGNQALLVGKTGSSLNSDTASEWAIYLSNESGDLRLKACNDVNAINLDGGNFIVEDTWYELVVNYDFASDLVEFYLAGALVGTSSSYFGASPPAHGFTRRLYVGGVATQEVLAGDIDIIQMWNRQLTSAEVAWLHNNGAARDPDGDGLEYPYNDTEADALSSGRWDHGVEYVSAGVSVNAPYIAARSFDLPLPDDRGPSSIDLQMIRSASTQVVTGTASFAVGQLNTVSSDDSGALGRENTVAQSGIAIGREHDIPVVSGTGGPKIALGNEAQPLMTGELAFSAGAISSAGDAQSFWVSLLQQTTSAVSKGMGNGSVTGDNIQLEEDSTYGFDILIIARRTDADNESALYHTQFGADRNTAGNAAFLGTPTVTTIHEDTAAWGVTLSVSGGDVVITVQGEAGKTIRWVANVRGVKVRG